MFTPLPPHLSLQQGLETLSQEIAQHLSIIAAKMNTQASMLAVSPALADYLNHCGLTDVLDQLNNHLALGNAINTAHRAICKTEANIVDVSPFSDKLAARGRVMRFEDGVFVVDVIPTPELHTTVEEVTL